VTLEHPHAELSAYIDDALDPAARAAVDGHLVACTVCRAHLAQLRATAALVHALPDPIPSRRLVPRLAAPAWLAPLRTLMTLASGAAVFLFIASALVSNITFLASGGATGTSAQESRDTALSDQAPKAAQPASTAAKAPAPVASPNAAFSKATPTQSPAPDAGRGTVSAASPDDRTRLDQARPSGAPALGVGGEGSARATSSAPDRSPLVNPWLWLTLAIVCGAIAIALHRRLRATV
jgi:anti-sigma factor RsiW